MEECESGKSAKWMRNFGISIGSKGERELLGGGRLLLEEEGRRGASGAFLFRTLFTLPLYQLSSTCLPIIITNLELLLSSGIRLFN